MNKISFKGSNAIIEDIVARFFNVDDEPAGSAGTERPWYAKALEEISAAGSVDLPFLELLFDYLIEHGTTKAKLDLMITERADELVRLALDIEILQRYRRDGTVTDVRIVDEWPF